MPQMSSGSLACVAWPSMAREIPAWDSLAKRAAEPNPFFESWYLLPSLEALDRTGRVSILRFEQDGILQGVMPIIRQSRYYRWPIPNMSGWVHANCFFGTPLVARGAEVPFWKALLRWADANPGPALFLHLREIALHGPLHLALEAVLAADQRPWAIVQREDRAMLASNKDTEAYIDSCLSKQKRKDLRRRSNRLSELGEIRFAWEVGTANLSDWIEQFLAIEKAGWKGKAGSALACAPETTAIFRNSLKGAAQRNRLIRLSLRLDGKPIAMLANFATPPGIYGYKTTYDETYARFSPGVLLELEYLSALDHPDIRWSDSCAAADHSVMNQIWRERRPIGRISVAIGGSLRRAIFRQLVSKEVNNQPAGNHP